MPPKTSKSQIAASARYNKARDNIMLRPSKEDGAIIRQAAEAAGKPVQRFVVDMVLERVKANKSE